jgi:hypothetical protein
MPDAHHILLAFHVVTGGLGLVLGPLAIAAERRAPHQSLAGSAYLSRRSRS